MNSTRGPARARLAAVGLVAVGLAALAISIIGGQLLWQSPSSRAEPPQPAQSSGEAIAGEPIAGEAIAGEGPAERGEESRFVRARERMVKAHLRDPRDGRTPIKSATVLEVMGRVRRQLFVAATVRPGRHQEPCLRGQPTADRPEPDDLPAVHRGLDDRVGGAQGGEPGAGHRHRFRLPGGRAGRDMQGGVQHRDRQAVGRRSQEAAEGPRLQEHHRASRRRVPGLAGEGPLRRDHRGRRPGPRAPWSTSSPRAARWSSRWAATSSN